MVYKAVLEPQVSPAFAITYFCNHCNIRFENTSKYVDTMTFFPKTWTKGHWSLDDLWFHVCWGHMCDSTQGSLCPSPMGIHQCMWIQWSILQITTYIHTHTYILHTYYIHTTYRMSDHMVSYWTQFRRDKKSQLFLEKFGDDVILVQSPSNFEPWSCQLTILWKRRCRSWTSNSWQKQKGTSWMWNCLHSLYLCGAALKEEYN